MGREWKFAAHKVTGRLNNGAMSSDEYPYTPPLNAETHRLRIYLADPAQPNEAQPNPMTQKDDVSVADGDPGVLLDRTEEEITEEAEAEQLVSLDGIADLPGSDSLRLQHQAIHCLAKAAGELPEDSTFLEYLRWVAAGA